MTLVLTIAQCRALIKILEEVDDRKVTMYQDQEVLVVDPSDPRGKVVDNRMFFIAPNGTISSEWVRPIATPDLEVVTPPADDEEEEEEEFECEQEGCDDTEPHAHADLEPVADEKPKKKPKEPEPKEVVDPEVVAPSSSNAAATK